MTGLPLVGQPSVAPGWQARGDDHYWWTVRDVGLNGYVTLSRETTDAEVFAGRAYRGEVKLAGVVAERFAELPAHRLMPPC